MSETVTDDGDVKRLITQHWGKRAAGYDERPHHGLQSSVQHQAWLHVLVGLAGPSPLRALDLGCGTGFLAVMLAELGHHVTGIDIAPEMIVLARQKAGRWNVAAEFRLGDVETLEDPDGSYDLVVARHLLWTLPNPADAVREWQRVLKPGGRLGLIEGHWENQAVRNEYEQIRAQLPFYGGLTSDELAQFLAAEGLRNVVIRALMDATLWGELPERPRFLVVGERDPSPKKGGEYR